MSKHIQSSICAAETAEVRRRGTITRQLQQRPTRQSSSICQTVKKNGVRLEIVLRRGAREDSMRTVNGLRKNVHGLKTDCLTGESKK